MGYKAGFNAMPLPGTDHDEVVLWLEPIEPERFKRPINADIPLEIPEKPINADVPRETPEAGQAPQTGLYL
jgi:hypothetical protein